MADTKPLAAAVPAENRFVFLGASNLARSFPHIIRLIETSAGRPGHSPRCEIYAALGHGRSYGKWSQVIVRHLPSIVESQLWDALSAAPATSTTRAILTDVGNDLMFGFSVKAIVAWLETCLKRLQLLNADIVVTRLPMQSVRRVTQSQFAVVRRLFFPRLRIGWQDIRNRAEQLDLALQQLYNGQQVSVVDPALNWYGMDPIHIRRSMQQHAWTRIMETWSGFSVHPQMVVPGWSEQLHWKLAVPAERKLFGMQQCRPQPCWERPHSSIHLY